MDMGRQFCNRKRVRLLAAFLAEGKSLTHVNRHISLEIRQAEIYAPIAAVGGPEQREERLVLVDRQQLPVAERPTFWREAEAHDSDFGKEWFSHGVVVG